MPCRVVYLSEVQNLKALEGSKDGILNVSIPSSCHVLIIFFASGYI